ncbi:MAG: hypothetical protein AAF585_13590 [Verrucomicrobiota bacterium]
MSDDLVSRRLHCLDAYRGFAMFFLASAGFGINQVAKIEGSPEGLQSLVFFVSHPEWISSFYLVGVSPWDLIQPAFMFMVGVSMPYSYASRERAGHSYWRRLIHAWIRAALLVALGVFLASAWKKENECPIVKRIWTPSWALFSGGYVIAILALLYLIIDVWNKKMWAWPMMVVGMNSMAMYMKGQLLKPWFRKQLMIHLPDAWFSGWGGTIVIYTSTALLMWLIVFWMWRSRIFLRV